jgi:hypothetical protein
MMARTSISLKYCSLFSNAWNMKYCMPLLGINGDYIDKFTGIRKNPDEIREQEGHHYQI